MLCHDKKYNKSRQNHKIENNAFTLVELIVVIITVGVITALAIPKYTMTVERFRAKEGEQILMTVLGAEKRYYLDHAQTYTTNFNNLDIQIPLHSYFSDVSMDTANGGRAFTSRTDGASNFYRLFIYFANAQIKCDNDTQAMRCTKLGY